jgi:hypothetical protein
MMSTQKYKVTMNKIVVNKDGDFPDQGEFSWNLMADDQLIASLGPPGRKVGDGDTIILGQSGEVTKSSTATLVVLGNVTEYDSVLKGGDDKGDFKHVYTKANNFGVGSHTAHLSDGKNLDVTVYYTIAKA